MNDWLLSEGIRILAILSGGIVGYRILKAVLMRALNRARNKEHEQFAALTTVTLSTLKAIVGIVVLLMLLQVFGFSITALLGALGLMGIAIGFGAQSFVRDVISYVTLVLADNVRVGEDVRIDGKRGVVEKFEFRGIVLVITEDDATWLAYVPYGKVTTVENFSRAVEDA